MLQHGVELIPACVQRRLILGLVGFRRQGAGWACGAAYIEEEVVDRMSDASWARFIQAYLTAASAMN